MQVKYLLQWVGWKSMHHQHKLQRAIITCASGLSALVAACKSATIGSCNRWQPPPVQEECLLLVEIGRHHKCRVQRPGCKVQLQPPPLSTIGAAQHNAAINLSKGYIVRKMVAPYIPLAQVVVVSSCNFWWRCFFIEPLAQKKLHLHSGNLCCVVVK